jgi:hypothetical protein
LSGGVIGGSVESVVVGGTLPLIYPLAISIKKLPEQQQLLALEIFIQWLKDLDMNKEKF